MVQEVLLLCHFTCLHFTSSEHFLTSYLGCWCMQEYTVYYIYIYAYLVIFDNGGGNLERDFSSARAFEMLSA